MQELNKALFEGRDSLIEVANEIEKEFRALLED